MFDYENQAKMRARLSPEAIQYINENR
jgi:hypothetical protein